MHDDPRRRLLELIVQVRRTVLKKTQRVLVSSCRGGIKTKEISYNHDHTSRNKISNTISVVCQNHSLLMPAAPRMSSVGTYVRPLR